MPAPSLPIPAPLTGEAGGTWAHSTVKERLPEIAARVIAENELLKRQELAVHQLISEIPDAPIRPLQDTGAPDFMDWVGYTRPHLGRTWLEVPWFFAETYFYRRILVAVEYFSEPPGSRRDPFLVQKQRGLDQMPHCVGRSQHQELSLQSAIDLSLWSNRSDLSLWPVESEQHTGSVSRQAGSEYILVDDLEPLLDHLEGLRRSDPRFDLVLDNVGVELAADLLLVDQLLARWPKARAVLHAKSHPTFVSDATRADVWRGLRHLGQSSAGAAGGLRKGLIVAAQAGRLLIQDDPFWTSPLALWQMPGHLLEGFSGSSLIILKGDANYRRALGDRHWPYNAPFRDILNYSPAPLAAMRTLKSQVACGIPAELAEATARQDPEWMTNGRWAQRQFTLPGS